MGYELYQSRHKGYEIDNLLDDVKDIKPKVDALEEGYDANKIKMADGTVLPVFLVTNMASKNDISDMATNTSVNQAISAATTDMATNTGVDVKITNATKDFVTGDNVDSKITNATKDFVTGTDVDGKISSATKDFVTGSTVDTKITAATKDYITGSETDTKITNATKDFITGTETDTKITNATKDFVTGTDVDKKIEDAAYELPTASTDILGGVKVDNDTITIDENGVIKSKGGGANTFQYDTMPDVTKEKAGTVVQYIGESNDNYILGRFYKAHVDEDEQTFSVPYSYTNNTKKIIKADYYAVKNYNDSVMFLNGVSVGSAIGVMYLQPGQSISITGGCHGTVKLSYSFWEELVEIDDSEKSSRFTYSSNKIEQLISDSEYELPIARKTVLGGVKPDGTTITVDADGTIHGAGSIDFLSDIGDVDISNAQNDQVLTFENNKWVNKDASGGGGSTSGDLYFGYDDYSTEEKVIGRWIDGKPIYKKVFTIPMPSSGTSATLDIDTGVIIERLLRSTISAYNTNWVSIGDPIGYSGSSPAFSVAEYSCTNQGHLHIVLNPIGPQFITDKKPINVIIEYTKTADAANSFKPSMLTNNILLPVAPSYDDYSEEEIVIGKWIDGRPLYRKYYEKTMASAKTDGVQVITDLATLDNSIVIHNMFSCLTENDNQNKVMLPWLRPNGSGRTDVLFDYTQKKLQVYDAFARTGTITVQAIIEYTKSTDAVNSFTPDMIKTIPLSSEATDEEVQEVIS